MFSSLESEKPVVAKLLVNRGFAIGKQFSITCNRIGF